VKYALYNSIRIDGSIFISRGEKIVWHIYLWKWLIVLYCVIAEKFSR
jgi:hypothetical protein